MSKFLDYLDITSIKKVSEVRKMLKEIQIENFKCFKDKVNVPLSKINLLTGLNGSGKSVFLHTILFASKGFYVSKNFRYKKDDGIVIKYLFDQEEKNLHYPEDYDYGRSLNGLFGKMDGIPPVKFPKLFFLSRSRLSAGDYLSYNFRSNEFDRIGEITADILGYKSDDYGSDGSESVDSIVFITMLAKKGDIIIIENPELNLHAKVQAKLIKFLVEESQSKGFQLFIETHSEHFVNLAGVLIHEKVIDCNKVSTLVFSREGDNFNIKSHSYDREGFLLNDWIWGCMGL